MTENRLIGRQIDVFIIINNIRYKEVSASVLLSYY
jgi:hypothetical protein